MNLSFLIQQCSQPEGEFHVEEATIVSITTAGLSVVGALGCIGIGHWLSTRAGEHKNRLTVRSYLDSLSTEVKYCGELAATYLEQSNVGLAPI